MEDTDASEGQEYELTVGYWKARLEEYNKWSEQWRKEAEAAERVYFQENKGTARPDLDDKAKYNILFSNTETLRPALYNRVPKVEVERIVRDERSGVGRTASIILERDTQRQMADNGLDSAAKAAVLDYLLSGRGSAWVSYEDEREVVEQPITDDMGMPIIDPATFTPITQPVEVIAEQKTRVDFVRWDDFAYAPSREWDAVWWAGRRLFMGKDEVKELAGEEVANEVCNRREEGVSANSSDSAKNKLEVWEVWNKRDKRRYYFTDTYPEFLAVQDVPVNIKGFFPCPKPLMGIRLTKDFLPKPEYQFYKITAERLNQVMMAINQILPAIAVRGTYDKSIPELANIFSKPGFANITPVDNFAGLRDKGGLGAALDLVDITVYVNAVQQLFQAKEQLTSIIYEITGIGDIIRGQGVASETATAQQIKGQWAALRIRNRQTDVQEFIRDIVRIAGEMIAELFEPARLVEMAGDLGDDQIYAEEAVSLLRDDTARTYRITIETDSTLEPDSESDKQRRTEFLRAVTEFMASVAPIVQAAPQSAGLMGELLKFGVRGFRVGRQLEQSIDQYVAQSQQMAQQAMMPVPAPMQPQGGVIEQGIPSTLPPEAGLGL